MNNNFDNFDKTFNRMFKVVATIIATVFFLMVIGFIFLFFVGVKGCQAVEKHGVKGVVEQVWNGPTNFTVSTNTP